MEKRLLSVAQFRVKQFKAERRKRRSLRIKRARNIEKNKRKASKSVQYAYKDGREKETRNISHNQLRFTAPPNFSLLISTENVLGFIKDITRETKIDGPYQIFINLQYVTNIDIGSICLLLSKMVYLTNRKVFPVAILPQDPSCNELIMSSGFIDHMRDIKGNKIKLNKEYGNLILSRGFDRTSNRLVGSEVKKAVQYLTGIEESYRPVFSIAQEICANSIEHANEVDKNWFFSVYRKPNSVVFTMTDIGHGILGTLRRKAIQYVEDTVTNKDDRTILIKAFDKRYSSVTTDSNRNKGLPKIKKISSENYIENLIVITNNVILNFSDMKKSKMLNNRFNGTFYYWEITQNCIEKWKKRKLT